MFDLSGRHGEDVVLSSIHSRIREIAQARVSYGHRRVHVLLRREGWKVNLKRVYRLYRDEGLSLRRKRPKRRRDAQPRQERPAASLPNERWSMDFMSDALADGELPRQRRRARADEGGDLARLAGRDPGTTSGTEGSDKARTRIAVDLLRGTSRTATVTTAGSTGP